MKIAFQILLFIFLGAVSLRAQPMIEFDTSCFRIAPVRPDTVIKFFFRFRNTGDSTLIISRVSHGDGGLMALLHRNTIPAGEKDSIEILFDAHNKPFGAWRKFLTVTSNALNNPNFSCSFGGLILPYDTLSWLNDFPRFANTMTRVEKISDRLFLFHTSSAQFSEHFDSATCLLVITKNVELVLINASSLPEQLSDIQQWCANHLRRKIAYCIITNSQSGSIGGAKRYNQYSPSEPIQFLTTEAIAKHNRTSYFLPEIFDNDESLYIGGETFEVFSASDTATQDNLVIYLKDKNLIYADDLIFNEAEIVTLSKSQINQRITTLHSISNKYPDANMIAPSGKIVGLKEAIEKAILVLKGMQTK